MAILNHTISSDKPRDSEEMLDLADMRVFKRQYEDNFRSLKYFGMQYIFDEDVVEDLIQDTWVKIWERQEAFPNFAAFRSFLFRSFYHALLDYLKHIRVETDYVDSLQPDEWIEEEMTARIIEAEIYQMVNAAFDELPDACRNVYAASLSGKSQREIADEFHITINTVKKHINNANHYLRRRLIHLLRSIGLIFTH